MLQPVPPQSSPGKQWHCYLHLQTNAAGDSSTTYSEVNELINCATYILAVIRDIV